MVKKQQPLLRGQVQENQTLEVGAVQRQTLRRQPRPPPGRQPQNPPLSQSGTCQRCGRAPAHDRQKCPARQARCRKCGKLGHFQAVCRTKSVSEVRLEDANDLDAFLGTVQSGDKHAWRIKLPLDEQEVEWRIDTGADVTAIPEKLFKQLPRKMLLPVYKRVRGAGQQLLSVKGRFRATLKKGGKAMSEEIYVIPNLRSPLLGVTAIEALGLAAQLQVVADELWPGMSSQLTDLVSNCVECKKHLTPKVQPLIPTELPQLPWQKVAMDLFEWKKKTYLLIVDFYSRYIEIALLNRLTSEEVVAHCQSIFARHGIPEQVVSDNGPQFAAEAFQVFAQSYGFDHVTSSPYYPMGNGEAERAVKTIKSLLGKETDPYLALLSYRATPLQVGYSPAELLMSRRLRTNIPTIREFRRPRVIDATVVAEKDAVLKERQKENFDSRHDAREQKSLNTGSNVWMRDREVEGTVVREAAP